MARATSSLPEPVSPEIRTVESVGATVWICAGRGQRLAAADDLFELIVAANLVFEVQLLARELRVQLFNPLVRHGIAHRNRDLPGHPGQQRKLIR